MSLTLVEYFIQKCFEELRGRSDKYLASLLEGATNVTEIYYRVVHFRRRLLSKFKSNRTRNFVLTACETGVFADFTKMEKEQYRSVIRFLFSKWKSRSEIKERLDAVYGDSSPSMATIKNWFDEFQRGRTSHVVF